MTYYVISTTSDASRGDAYRDESLARRHFNRIAATGMYVRLLAMIDGVPVEMKRLEHPPYDRPHQP